MRAYIPRAQAKTAAVAIGPGSPSRVQPALNESGSLSSVSFAKSRRIRFDYCRMHGRETAVMTSL